jgi:hypothetical protein
MYIGSYSAQALFLFLQGYECALKDQRRADLSGYDRFIDGLYGKYGRGGGGDSWATVLAGVAGGDAIALDLFFNELEFFENSTE